MNTNKIVIISSVIIIILIISIPTGYKVIKNYQNNLFKVVEEKIIDSAKRCYYENVCQNDKITLEFLYQNNYLSKVSNPITKEDYSKNSYVLRKDKSFKFFPIEWIIHSFYLLLLNFLKYLWKEELYNKLK